MQLLSRQPQGFYNYARRDWIKQKVRPLVLAVGFLVTVVIVYGSQQQVWAGQADMTGLKAAVSQGTAATYATTPQENKQTWQPFSLGTQDIRAYVLDRYLSDNSSPLAGTGNLFVEACDTYKAPADCITVVAIARAETDLCKYHTSASYYNCWGYGGGGIYRIYFNSWRESIFRVTRTLVNNYGTQSIINPSLMERTFCGDEPGCTGWGNRVKFHMQIIDEYPKKMGLNFKMTDFR